MQMTTKEFNESEIHLNLQAMQKDIAKGKRHSQQKTLRHAKSFQLMKHKADTFKPGQGKGQFPYGRGPKDTAAIEAHLNRS